MTKQDYIKKIAEIFKTSRKLIAENDRYEGNDSNIALGVQIALERDFADMFSRDNPRFDGQKFYEYIGHNFTNIS